MGISWQRALSLHLLKTGLRIGSINPSSGKCPQNQASPVSPSAERQNRCKLLTIFREAWTTFGDPRDKEMTKRFSLSPYPRVSDLSVVEPACLECTSYWNLSEIGSQSSTTAEVEQAASLLGGKGLRTGKLPVPLKTPLLIPNDVYWSLMLCHSLTSLGLSVIWTSLSSFSIVWMTSRPEITCPNRV